MSTKAYFPGQEAKIFGAAVEIEWQASPGLCRHQIDIGLSTTGSGVLSVDFGTGYRYQIAVSFTETAAERLPISVEGNVVNFKFTPTGVSVGGYSVSYTATFVG